MKHAYVRNGAYYCQFTNPLNGERIQKKIGDSKSEAKANLDALLSAYGLGSENSNGSHNAIIPNKPIGCGWEIAYQMYYDAHISDYKINWQEQLSLILTRLNDTNNLNNVADYEYKHVQAFINRYKHKMKGATINKYLAVVSAFFDYCILMKWVENNPCVNVKHQDEEESDPYHFSDVDLKTLFANANGYTDWWTFLLETGIRACDAKTFTQSNFIVQDRMYVQFKQHKHGSKAKSIKLPLTKKAVKIVEGAGKVIFPKCYRWLNRKGYSGHYNGFLVQSQKLMRELLGGKGNPEMMRVEHHTFRHTFAINHLNAGMPKEVLQTLLGHSTMSTTEKHYANWITDVSLNQWVD